MTTLELAEDMMLQHLQDAYNAGHDGVAYFTNKAVLKISDELKTALHNEYIRGYQAAKKPFYGKCTWCGKNLDEPSATIHKFCAEVQRKSVL